MKQVATPQDLQEASDSFYGAVPMAEPELDDLVDKDYIIDDEELEDLSLEDVELTEEEEEVFDRLSKKKQKQDFILQTFKQLKEKPEDAQIDAWKAQYGNAYLVSLSEEENYVFRPLNRAEWRALKANSKKLDDDQRTDLIAMKGCLFPRLNSIVLSGLPAGTAEALRDMIFEASNFMTPDRAMGLVRRL